jgi:heat shock protein HslJ
MKFLLTIFLSALALSTCKNKSSEKNAETILFVNSSKVECTGVGKMLCLQTQESETLKPNDWKNFYGNIEGFEYESGYIYKLSVKKEKLDPATVPADASTLKYSLVKVIEKNRDEKMRLHDIWALRAIDGNMIDVGNFQKHPVLEIHLNDMKIFGNDGCNTMFGSIETLDEKTIVFGAIGGTKMACSNMELSSKYTSGLEKTKTYKLDGLQLYLYDADGNELLRYENGGLK